MIPVARLKVEAFLALFTDFHRCSSITPEGASSLVGPVAMVLGTSEASCNDSRHIQL